MNFGLEITFSTISSPLKECPPDASYFRLIMNPIGRNCATSE